MKRKDLLRRLSALGWTVIREAANPTVFGKPGRTTIPVPRHSEINEYTARAILIRAAREE